MNIHLNEPLLFTNSKRLFQWVIFKHTLLSESLFDLHGIDGGP